MADPAKATSVTSPDGLRRAWELFRRGGVVACAADEGPMALAVDESIGTYRFVCAKCGIASAWFEAGPEGIRIMGHSTPPHGSPAKGA
jgi:hypothetical protein